LKVSRGIVKLDSFTTLIMGGSVNGVNGQSKAQHLFRDFQHCVC
jgi:hypothetical protein